MKTKIRNWIVDVAFASMLLPASALLAERRTGREPSSRTGESNYTACPKPAG